VNKEKTIAMELNREKRKGVHTPMQIAGSNIKWVNEVKYLGITLQRDFNWEGHLKGIVSKMNKLGNMVLQQVGKFVEQKDRVYLLDSCALDLYGVEFCREVNKKVVHSAAVSYHWLIKRCMGENKFFGNHAVCAESGLLTWEMKCLWREFILWKNISNSSNEIMKILFGDNKWETALGESVLRTLMHFGREVKNAKELKSNMLLHVEAVAILKEMEEN